MCLWRVTQQYVGPLIIIIIIIVYNSIYTDKYIVLIS